MQFRISQKAGHFLIETEGVARVAGFAEFIEALLLHPGWERGTPLLIDHSQLDVSGISSDDIQAISRDAQKLEGVLGHLFCAIVTSSDLSYGLGRMWVTFSEAMDADPPSLMVFRNRKDAETWLSTVVSR